MTDNRRVLLAEGKAFQSELDDCVTSHEPFEVLIQKQHPRFKSLKAWVERMHGRRPATKNKVVQLLDAISIGFWHAPRAEEITIVWSSAIESGRFTWRLITDDDEILLIFEPITSATTWKG